jgi:hypothetical protein
MSLRVKRRIIQKAINYFGLDLEGLTVFTELGSNDYLFTSITAALAGAEKVYAITRDSGFGTAEELIQKHKEICDEWGVPDVIEVVFDKKEEYLSQSDIVTNSGFVRPIDHQTLEMMPEHAVVPLMWETWEYRPQELDLDYAIEKGILVAGTYEYFLYTNNGFVVSKLLFEAGKGVYKDNILVIASGRIGRSISKFFAATSVEHSRIVFDDEYSNEEKEFIISPEVAIQNLAEFDAIVIAEHHHNVDLISDKGLLSPELISKENPDMQLIHICGSVDINDINNSGVQIYPDKPAAFGYMTTGAASLDSHAVLELNTAGLRVGEIMARLRRDHSPAQAYEKLASYKIADPFDGLYV